MCETILPFRWGCLSSLLVMLLVAGCGPSPTSTTTTGSAGESPSPKVNAASSAVPDDVQELIGQYMPPVDGGRVEIAAPKGWQWSRAGNEYLVAFHQENTSLNDLPRIFVSAEDSPFSGVSEVDANNLPGLVTQVAASLGDTHMKSPPTALTLGGRGWVEYVGLGKRRNSLVAKQVLQTVAGGRLYTLRLETLDARYAGYRSAALAVAASFRPAESVAAPAATPDAPLDGEQDSSTDAEDAPPAEDSDAPGDATTTE